MEIIDVEVRVGLAGETQACVQVLVERRGTTSARKNPGSQISLFWLLTFDLLMQNDAFQSLLVCCLPGKTLIISNAAQYKEPGGTHVLIVSFMLTYT